MDQIIFVMFVDSFLNLKKFHLMKKAKGGADNQDVVMKNIFSNTSHFSDRFWILALIWKSEGQLYIWKTMAN